MPFVPGGDFPQTGANRTRANAQIEICEYIGGTDDAKELVRAGHSWDAAVREFNSCPWKFNRMTQDIPLSSSMLDAASAPTVSRDAGTGAGFVLSSGRTITYWAEERVKDGEQITRRNLTISTSQTVTLTGDGTTDKPVITRPTTVNADTTHWALFGTATNGAFPDGNEIAEVAIATTTIEDTRTGNNPEHADGDPYYVGTGLLEAEFRNPKFANLLDDKGHESYPVDYLPWEEFQRCYGEDRILTASTIDAYTVRNAHQTGIVTWYPRILRPATYPKLRIVFHRRIALASADTDRLNVPVEVDQAIFDLAVAHHIAKSKGFIEASASKKRAAELRLLVERDWRDWPPKDPG
jgi:hypothetical protein